MNNQRPPHQPEDESVSERVPAAIISSLAVCAAFVMLRISNTIDQTEMHTQTKLSLADFKPFFPQIICGAVVVSVLSGLLACLRRNQPEITIAGTTIAFIIYIFTCCLGICHSPK